MAVCPIDAEQIPDPVTHYVIVRRDLPRGIVAAQIVHAAGESSPGDLTDGTYAVVLAAANEAELTELERRLVAGGLPHKAIREPNLNNTLTAIGVRPARKSTFRKWLSSIPLYR